MESTLLLCVLLPGGVFLPCYHGLDVCNHQLIINKKCDNSIDQDHQPNRTINSVVEELFLSFQEKNKVQHREG